MIKYLKTAFGLSAAILIVGLLFCIAPWLLFWSIETLFGVVVPFTFWTWLAAVVLLSLVRGGKLFFVTLALAFSCFVLGIVARVLVWATMLGWNLL